MWKSEDAGKRGRSLDCQNRDISRVSLLILKTRTLSMRAVLGNIYKPTEERGVYKSTNGGKVGRKCFLPIGMQGC